MKKALSLFVTVLGLILGTTGIAIVADMPVFPGQFTIDWPRVDTFALLGFGGLIPSISAIRKPRVAALLFLLVAPVIAVCVSWWLRRTRNGDGVSLSQLILVSVGFSVPFIVFGVFWLLTCRAGWPTIAPAQRVSKLLATIMVDGSIFLVCLSAGLFLSLYLQVNGWVYCRQKPPITEPQYPDQAVFTAKLLLASHGVTPLRHVLASWSLLRVERRFWGVPSWAGLVILRTELPKMYADEYFIDARRSQGFLMHFFPVIEYHVCSRTQPLEHAMADLRTLQDGSPKLGVRIIGQVYEGELITNKPVQGVLLWISGPNGIISTTTDTNGMYDLVGLPAGHYSIKVDPAFLHRRYPYSRETDLKSGEIWNPFLTTDIYGAYAP